MTTIVKMSKDDERLDNATRWILRVEEGLNLSETEELQEWLDEDPENVSALLRIAKVWDKLDSLSLLSDLVPHDQSTPATWPRRNVFIGAAATAAVVAIAAFLTLGVENPASGIAEPVQISQSFATYETAIGEQSTVTLQDGTVVVLNTNSRLSVDYMADARVLRLDRGEIHVDVAEDADRPLSVIVGDRIVQAVGTSFGIEITDDQTIDLVVTEGKVVIGILDPVGGQSARAERWEPRVLAQSTENVVAAGEALILDDLPKNARSVSPEEIEVKLSWRDGSLIFKGEVLEEAIAEVERYTTVQFEFVDEELKSRTVTGRFKAGDVEGLLISLRLHFNISHEYASEDRVLLSSL